MAVHPSVPAQNLAEFVAYAKANPGKINFVNQNAAANVSGVLFENLTKQKVQFIPYRGAGPAMTDLIAGTVDLLVVQGAVALPQIRGGKIKALANLSPQRSASCSPRLGTPCALKMTVAPSGTWSSSSTNTAPRARRRSTTNLLCTTSWRT